MKHISSVDSNNLALLIMVTLLAYVKDSSYTLRVF